MKLKSLAAAAALSIAACAPAFAQAQVYTDDMAKCLVKSSTAEDQTGFVVWVFTAMSAHPAVQPYAKVTEAQRQEHSKRAAALMQRLMTVDCRKETAAALKYEGTEAIGQAFKVLGGAAMRGLMGDPAVTKAMDSLDAYVDEAAFEGLLKEAGITTDSAKKK